MKVNHTERSSIQQMTAGVMAAILLVIPFWIICAFLMQLAAYPWFFDFLVLYLCLSDACFKQIAQEIRLALNSDDKARAKKLLQPWVAQDTQSLSEVGICKTTIEKLANSHVYGVVATIFYFAVAGAPLVLAVRMVKQIEMAWPIADPRFKNFGIAIAKLNTILQILPNFLWAFTLTILTGPLGYKALIQTTNVPTPFPLEHLIQRITGIAINIELGGPRKYLAQRVALPYANKGRQPVAQDIGNAISYTSKGFGIWLGLLITLPLLWSMLRYVQV
ncbi:cobalamin biosynthesis protein CbiB [Shewanella gelidii]|uniref:Cobalamin biosynthesis protein CbiB n=1 Tax=Shewanella gelidii TaxID=1642821 RepID=A0A917JLE4_9GAMM|nr:cobalamin biosynthesis protein CbiB [Shewanella gelidii]